MVPLGLWLTWRPWLIGTAVSMLAVLLLMTTLQIPAPNNYVEYLSLIAFSALAAEFASRTKRTRRPP
jgi:hypothetical protein